MAREYAPVTEIAKILKVKEGRISFHLRANIGEWEEIKKVVHARMSRNGTAKRYGNDLTKSYNCIRCTIKIEKYGLCAYCSGEKPNVIAPWWRE
jgi:hypothetical protein